LYSSSNDKRLEKDEVTLMTIHTAKGTEYKIVFLIGMNEGVFPSVRPSDNSDKLEEERRTAYVGITRAMDKLFISAPGGYDPIHKVGLTPSRFIREIGNNNFQSDTRTSFNISQDDDSWFDSNADIDYSKNYEEKLEEINEGDQIIHTIFGEGLVLSRKDDFIDVLFKHPHGPKTLMWKHKNIKRKI
jgi:DNA helicase-2/ATP-dependent DNA helicase PcrA